MTDWTTQQRGTGQYADVNGLHLYYETHGPTEQATGRPLILLHGGLGSGEMFGPVIPTLAVNRQVVAADLQGHGRTADIDRPLSIQLMADDIAALIGQLGSTSPTCWATRWAAASDSSPPPSTRSSSASWSWCRRTSGATRSRPRCWLSRPR
jgi:alpha-beta hydrolase superfamily lysophospholipase